MGIFRLSLLSLALLGTVAGCGSDASSGGGGGDDDATSAGPGSGSSTPSSGSGSSGGAQELCVSLINEHRASIDLPPYERWTDAEDCSSGEAESDSQTGEAHGAFGACGENAQNECPGWPGPPDQMIGGCLQMMWDEGPGEDFNKHGHYINMSSTQYSKVACGFHVLDNGDVWSVQNFK